MSYIKKQPRTQIKTGRDIAPITLDGGVNRYGTIFNIAPNEAWDCRNTTSKIPGVLSVRPIDTEKLTKLPDGPVQFSYSNGILGLNSYTINAGTVAGTDIVNLLINNPNNPTKYYVVRWNPALGVVGSKSYPLTADRESTIISLQTDEDDYTIVCNTQGVYETHGGDYTLIDAAPKTNLYTVDDYRLFALRRNVLSWCNPEDITDWSTGDAGQQIITDMKGTGTAIITLKDAVIAFSGKSMHILYGDDTGNYVMGDVIDHGCVGFRALAKTDNAVYFLDYDGLKVYSNGVVDIVSNKINYWIERANMDIIYVSAMAINGDYLYLSIPSINSALNNLTFELNLKTGVFNLWNEAYKAFTKVGNKFYGAQYTGFVEIGTKTSHSEEWYHETPMRRSQFNPQTVSQIPVLVDLPQGSTLKLAYNVNDKTPSWVDLYTFTPKAQSQEVFIDIPMTILNNAAMYQLKFYGTGPCVIHEIGSDGRVMIR